LKSQDTVSPIAFAFRTPSRQASQSDPLTAGVMPVQWNQSASAKTASQSIIPVPISAAEEPSRSYSTFPPRWTAPFSRK